MRRSVTPLLAAAIAVVVVTTLSQRPAAQRAVGTSAISGRVTVDKGDVRALRVKARDTVNRIMYTVFTTGGRYQILNLPASTYDVQVLEEVFDSPFTFDIGRQPNPHVAFGGGGAHHCLGAMLARAEIRAVLDELLLRGDNITLGDAEVAYPNLTTNMSIYDEMPVTLSAR